jgi:hypothetical protein
MLPGRFPAGKRVPRFILRDEDGRRRRKTGASLAARSEPVPGIERFDWQPALGFIHDLPLRQTPSFFLNQG